MSTQTVAEGHAKRLGLTSGQIYSALLAVHRFLMAEPGLAQAIEGQGRIPTADQIHREPNEEGAFYVSVTDNVQVGFLMLGGSGAVLSLLAEGCLIEAARARVPFEVIEGAEAEYYELFGNEAAVSGFGSFASP